MENDWQFQIRVDIADVHAPALRESAETKPDDPLQIILRRHRARAVCQYDAFAGYCAEAEREGVESYPLYAWTKATLEDPVKKAKYLKSFTLYIDGDQVYPKPVADSLEADLRPLIGGGEITRLHKYNTNPANNPQPPRPGV